MKNIRILFIFILCCFFISVASVNAEETEIKGIRFNFYTAGREVIPIDNDVITTYNDLVAIKSQYEDGTEYYKYEQEYTINDTINAINSIDGNKFQIKGATEKSEWFPLVDEVSGVYFKNNKKYTVKKILELLNITSCTGACTMDGYYDIGLSPNTSDFSDNVLYLSDISISKGEEYFFSKKYNRTLVYLKDNKYTSKDFTLTANAMTFGFEKFTNIVWTSETPDVCTINENNGKAKFINKGLCKIKVEAGSRSKYWEAKAYFPKIDTKKIVLDGKEAIKIPIVLEDEEGNSDKHPVYKYANTSITFNSPDGSDKKVKTYNDNKIKVSFQNDKDKKISAFKFKRLDASDIYNKKVIAYFNGIKVATFEVSVSPSLDSGYEIRFLDTSHERGANATVMKAKDKKGEYHYALIDTALENGGYSCDNLERDLLRFADNSSSITLDYLIVSHNHGDHAGCLKYLMESSNVKIDTVIQKVDNAKNGMNAKFQATKYKKNGVKHIVDPVSLSGTDSYKKLELGTVELRLYNYKNVFAKDDCSANYRHIVFYEPNGDGYKTAVEKKSFVPYKKKNEEGKTVYYGVRATEPNKLVLIPASELKNYVPTDDINKKIWVAVNKIAATTASACNRNANSIAVLVKVPFNKNSRYIYIPGDLENSGYSFGGWKESDSNSVPIEGIGSGVNYVVGEDGKTLSRKGSVEVKKNSESKVAKQIKKDLGSDLSKIIIYQESHHGFNNAEDAMKSLGFKNNANLYRITLSNHGNKTYSNAWKQRTYYQSLGPTDNNYVTGKHGEITFSFTDNTIVLTTGITTKEVERVS